MFYSLYFHFIYSYYILLYFPSFISLHSNSTIKNATSQIIFRSQYSELRPTHGIDSKIIVIIILIIILIIINMVRIVTMKRVRYLIEGVTVIQVRKLILNYACFILDSKNLQLTCSELKEIANLSIYL